MVVVLYEVLIAHSRLLLDEDAGFDDLSEASRVRVACFEDHYAEKCLDWVSQLYTLSGENVACFPCTIQIKDRAGWQSGTLVRTFHVG